MNGQTSEQYFRKYLNTIFKNIYTPFSQIFTYHFSKIRPKNQNKLILGGFLIQIMIQIGPLSSGLGCFSWHYIPLFDNARHWPVLADFGAHWILKESQNRFLMPRWEALRSNNEHLAFFFCRIIIFDEKYIAKVIPNQTKSEPRAPKGWIYMICLSAWFGCKSWSTESRQNMQQSS